MARDRDFSERRAKGREDHCIAFAAAATTVGGSNSLPRPPERNKPATDDGMDGRPSLLRAQQHGVDADRIRRIKVLLLCIKRGILARYQIETKRHDCWFFQDNPFLEREFATC